MLLVDLVILFTIVLIVVLVVTGAYGLWVRVPFVPTPSHVADAMVAAARLRGDERVYDLGAGDGTILIHAKRAHPGISAIGVEIVPTVWLWGRWKIWRAKTPITFLRKNVMQMN